MGNYKISRNCTMRAQKELRSRTIMEIRRYILPQQTAIYVLLTSSYNMEEVSYFFLFMCCGVHFLVNILKQTNCYLFKTAECSHRCEGSVTLFLYQALIYVPFLWREPHRWGSGKHALLECDILCVRAPVGSIQRL